uniref:Large ribosomal subunit protein bL9c n=1 Tax=Osmundea sinicola TaxID=290685 RepID=A0A7L4WPM8_9FLOR|nr:ribosomal protein L9 [Osmundea sinicola]QFR99966.1 ribosomal protein L9 [Osmundea sinicola]
MKKKIQVILKNNALNQKQTGEIINVSPGYAFNYLIPNGMAEIATKNHMKHYTMFSKIQKKKQEAASIINQRAQNKIDKISKITIYKKIGSNKLIFGSIKEKDIINWINQYANLNIDKKQIKIANINKISMHNISIELQNNIITTVKLCILPYSI